MSRGLSIAIIGVLILSALVTALTSAVTSPRNAPDERHHYSYVKHLADNPLPFPPRLEEIRTDGGDPNHLMHPPLYYYLMAIPHRMLHLEQQLTSVGRSVDEYGVLSSGVAIPPLRAASFLVALAHLGGLFVLLSYLVRTELLSGWAALVAAACLALVPGFTFVAGTLNNDVLALAVWPFLTLVTVRFLREGRRTDVYLTALLVGIAVLTKATLWPLALVSALAVVARIITDVWVPGEGRGWLRRTWGRIRPASRWRAGVLVAGALSMFTAGYVLATNIVRYGQVQPGYTTVFRIPLEESKFYSVPESGVDPVTIGEFALRATTLTFRSLFGILTHEERIYSPNPGRLTHIVIALTVLALALIVSRLWPRRGNERGFGDWLAAGMVGTALLFLATLLSAGWASYYRMNHFAAQGRYLIGYVDLWVIGLLILVSRTRATARGRRGRAFSGVMALVVAGVLLALMVDPFYYLSRTSELHESMGVAERVRLEAEARGMSEVPLEAVSPDGFVEHGAGIQGGMLPGPRFLMAWTDATVVGPFDVSGDCVEVWVYGRGDEAWGEPAVLEVRLAGRDGSATTVPLPRRPEVAEVILPASELEDATLQIRHTNIQVDSPQLVSWFWPRTRIVHLFSAYAGSVNCQP